MSNNLTTGRHGIDHTQRLRMDELTPNATVPVSFIEPEDTRPDTFSDKLLSEPPFEHPKAHEIAEAIDHIFLHTIRDILRDGFQTFTDIGIEDRNLDDVSKSFCKLLLFNIIKRFYYIKSSDIETGRDPSILYRSIPNWNETFSQFFQEYSATILKIVNKPEDISFSRADFEFISLFLRSFNQKDINDYIDTENYEHKAMEMREGGVSLASLRNNLKKGEPSYKTEESRIQLSKEIDKMLGVARD